MMAALAGADDRAVANKPRRLLAPLAGRNALITGCNTGIGQECARQLAEMGATIYMACRDQAKAARAREEIMAAVPGLEDSQLQLLSLDLASQKSIRDCAQTFTQLGAPLHILLNNAGLAGPRRAGGTTAEGIELTIGTNHLGVARCLCNKAS